MPYVIGADLPDLPAGERFRALLERPGILQMPGAHLGIAALLAKKAGFDALYMSGAAMSATMGLPDLGMITVDDVCWYIRQVVRSSALPVLVDGDTGYGEALNVMHMVRGFEDAGAAAVHLEDQLLPKKCGHLNDKKLVDGGGDVRQGRGRAEGAPAPLHHRAHGCGGEFWHGRRHRPRQPIPGGRRRRDLPRGADDARDVRGNSRGGCLA